MKVRNEIRNGTFNQSISKPSKNPKNPDMKGLLDSTKHTTFEGPKLPGMNKPLKPIPVFKQNPELGYCLGMPAFVKMFIPNFMYLSMTSKQTV